MKKIFETSRDRYRVFEKNINNLEYHAILFVSCTVPHFGDYSNKPPNMIHVVPDKKDSRYKLNISVQTPSEISNHSHKFFS